MTIVVFYYYSFLDQIRYWEQSVCLTTGFVSDRSQIKQIYKSNLHPI